MDGVLAIDKPPGMTSHDVVDAVRKRLGTRKVGHAGTLDPGATGLLLIGVGRATRFLSYAQEAPKRYRAEARFGVSTTTQDAWGEVVAERSVTIERDDVDRALKDLIGVVEQVPPMVSAVKVGGERLYKKARRGEEVDRVARTVTVYAFELTDLDLPNATFDVHCSAGTFVRTLIHDLGEALGCGAHMTALRRTEAGGFTEADAIPLEDVATERIRPLVDIVRELPRFELDEAQDVAVGHGRPLTVRLDVPEGGPIALVREGELRAVYRPKDGVLVADRVLSS